MTNHHSEDQARDLLRRAGTLIYHDHAPIKGYGAYEEDQPIAVLMNAARRVLATPCDEPIYRNNKVYLERWHLCGQRDAASRAYLHRFREDDDDVPHDHPRDNVALNLAGRSTEEWWPDGDHYARGLPGTTQAITDGTIITRPAAHTHRIPPAGMPPHRRHTADSACRAPQPGVPRHESRAPIRRTCRRRTGTWRSCETASPTAPRQSTRRSGQVPCT